MNLKMLYAKYKIQNTENQSFKNKKILSLFVKYKNNLLITYLRFGRTLFR
jgi:hypothetical protein